MGVTGGRWAGTVLNWKLCSWRRARRVPPGRGGQDHCTGCGSASCRHPSGPFTTQGGEPLLCPCSPKHDNTGFQHQESSTSTPPRKTILIGSSALGRCRLLPATLQCKSAAILPELETACSPTGRRAPWDPLRPPPLRLERFQGQRRSDAGLCARSAVLLLLLLFTLRFLLPLPSATAPAAGSSAASLPRLLLSPR